MSKENKKDDVVIEGVEFEVEGDIENENINDSKLPNDSGSTTKEKSTKKCKKDSKKQDKIKSEVESSKNNTTRDEGSLNKDLNEIKEKAKNVFSKFNEYINSDDFDNKCKEKSEKIGVDKDFIKNSYIKRVLGKIGKVLNIAVDLGVDIIKSSTNFLNNLIIGIVNFTSETLHKVVNFLTLGCAN